MSVAKPPEERMGNPRTADVEKVKAEIVDMEWVTPEPPGSIEDITLWANVWELGGPTGVYHAVADYGLVQRYVELMERRQKMQTLLELEGYVVVGSQGQDVQHPAARIISDIEGRLIPIEDRLGLSPQSRHTILIGRAKAAKSEFEKWNEEED